MGFELLRAELNGFRVHFFYLMGTVPWHVDLRTKFLLSCAVVFVKTQSDAQYVLTDQDPAGHVRSTPTMCILLAQLRKVSSFMFAGGTRTGLAP